MYLRQGGVPDHQPFGFLEPRVALCDHIHGLFPDELQGVQAARDHSFTLRRRTFLLDTASGSRDVYSASLTVFWTTLVSEVSIPMAPPTAAGPSAAAASASLQVSAAGNGRWTSMFSQRGEIQT